MMCAHHAAQAKFDVGMTHRQLGPYRKSVYRAVSFGVIGHLHHVLHGAVVVKYASKYREMPDVMTSSYVVEHSWEPAFWQFRRVKTLQ
jgi:hypothetical protein